MPRRDSYINPLKYTDDEMLDRLVALSKRIGKLPTTRDIYECENCLGLTQTRHRLGTIADIHKAILNHVKRRPC